MNPSALQAAIGAALADIGAVAVGFGVVNNALVGTIITAVMGVVSVVFLVANELDKSTKAKVAMASTPASKK